MCLNGAAQQRLVGDVKKSIDALTMTVEKYSAAYNKLKPALTHEQTRDRAETWTVAGRILFGKYDKYNDNRRVGKKVDAKDMGHSLLDGFDAFMRALPLDTIRETDKKGQPRIDKKTGQQRVKTKFSHEIVSRLAAHHSDFRFVGSELYNIKDWDGAYDAWERYCKIAQYNSVPDSVLGEVRYLQGIAAWQRSDNADAVRLFATARQLGYKTKETYDYALSCLSAMGDEKQIVELAEEAYRRFGTDDSQYIRILINNHIANNQLDSARALLDKAIAIDDNDAGLHNLMGLVLEQQEGINQALPHFERCIQLDPNHPQGLFNVGRYYYNEATLVAERYPRLSGRALSRKAEPLYKEALPYLEKSYQIDPTNEDVRNALRNIYYHLGDAAKLQALEQ